MLTIYQQLMKMVGSSDALSQEDRQNLWALQRFLEFHVFSFTKFFDETLDEDHDDNYYMEREWRVMGSVKFRTDQVERIIVPRSFASRFRSEVPNYQGQLQYVD